MMRSLWKSRRAAGAVVSDWRTMFGARNPILSCKSARHVMTWRRRRRAGFSTGRHPRVRTGFSAHERDQWAGRTILKHHFTTTSES